MELLNTTTRLPAQIVRPDLRPTADAAAVAHNPRPAIPMPLPSTLGPLDVINQSRLAGIAAGLAQANPAERVLKSYSTLMLPYGPGQNAASSKHQAANNR